MCHHDNYDKIFEDLVEGFRPELPDNHIEDSFIKLAESQEFHEEEETRQTDDEADLVYDHEEDHREHGEDVDIQVEVAEVIAENLLAVHDDKSIFEIADVEFEEDIKELLY